MLNLHLNRQFDIISIGECMVELCRTQGENHFKMSFGGDTLNVIVAASRLGGKTGYITKVGNDMFGDYLLECFKKENIDIACIKQCSAPTGIYFIINAPDRGHKFIYYRKNSSASFLKYQDIDINYLKKAKIIHTSGITQAISKSCQQLVKKILKTVKKYDCIISYDTNLRLNLCDIEEAKQNFNEILEYIDIIFLNFPYESENLLELKNPQEIFKYLHLKGIKIVILKTGKDGCIISYNQQQNKIHGNKDIKVIDTSGAGDAFAGAFLYALCNKLIPYNCAEFANKIAQMTISKHGTVNSYVFD